jgi:predicted HTH transcriptional regulator
VLPIQSTKNSLVSSCKTAARDLDDLVEKGVFESMGEKRGSYYILAAKK